VHVIKLRRDLIRKRRLNSDEVKIRLFRFATSANNIESSDALCDSTKARTGFHCADDITYA